MAKKPKEIKEDCIRIGKWHLLYAWVCSRLSEEESLEWLRKNHPAGTSGNWGKINYGEHPESKPVKCSDYPDRMHYQFVC